MIKTLKEYGIVKYGDFTLKSGAHSNIYFNMKEIIQHPTLMTDICYALSKFITNKKDVAIVGVPMGAIPFASLISHITSLPMMLVRTEKKEYGMQNQVEGTYNNTTIIEDVITSASSVMNIITILKENNIHVSQIISILDREAGGTTLLRSMGYQVDCLFKLSDFYTTPATLPLHTNDMIDRLLHIKKEKHSKLIASLDCDNLYEVMEMVGPYVCAIKIHGDIFECLDVERINNLKDKYHFLVIEDRKFSDIPYICLKQLKLVKRYADIVTVHGVCGESLVQTLGKEIAVIIVANMSLKDNLIDRVYTNKVLDFKCDNLVGYVSQYKINNYLTFTPGIHLDIMSDDLNQQYHSPTNESDFYIIGRGLYDGNITENIKKYIHYINNI